MRPEPELTPLEEEVLARFFSRTRPRAHADVYLVRNLPQEIRATLNGLYSRSHLSMRRTFLRRLEQGLAQQGRSLADLPLPATSEDVLAGVLVDKAGEFLRTYAIDHGHNSLREGAVLHVAVENVSQLATRFMQRERRASFEESSTRYISFAKEGHWRDPEVAAAGPPWADLQESSIAESFAFYEHATRVLADHVGRRRPRQDGEDEKAWRRAVRAEAFDSARYLLTPALFTKFGLVADARTVADMVTALVSQPLAELRTVGRRLREEAERDVPTLLAHARPNDYLEGTRAELAAIAGEIGLRETAPAPVEGEMEVRLVEAPPDLDDRLLASLLFEDATRPLAEVRQRVGAMTPAARAALFDRVLAKRGGRDPVPAGFEGGGLFDFEVLIDFGAYRDVGRHRKGFQQQQGLTTAHGFAVPPLVDEAGLGDDYRRLMRSVGENARSLAERFPLQARYLIPFAYLQRVRLQFDARQMAYFLELRSAPEGHFSYRDLAVRMGRELDRVAPLYAQWVRLCDADVVLGRVEAEHGAGERRARRRRRARDLGFD